MTRDLLDMSRRPRGVRRVTIAAALLLAAAATAQDEVPPAGYPGLMWLVSPLVGCNRDDLKQRDRTGQIQTVTETARRRRRQQWN